MNIGLVGSGGREHALCKALYNSKKVGKIFCFPGNAGTSKLATNIKVDILNFKKVLSLIKYFKIDLVIIGPEEPLVRGLVDYLKQKKVKVFGPNKYASKLEGSKAFMKNLCLKNNIPTAKFKICKNGSQVSNFLNKCNFPIVVKADGLAAGKGVTICKTKKEAMSVSVEILKGKFKSSKKLILEEFLEGEEASYFLIVDNKSFKFFGTAQDHKRVYEKDKGPNTGGMGAYSPAHIINKNVEKKIINKIINPTLLALKRKKNPYNGFLYVGLMIKGGEPYLIEYNVRMGDPECQTILPLLKSDFLDLILSCCDENLDSQTIRWDDKKSMCVVLCSNGYPEKFRKNVEINNLDKINNSNTFVYHAGTELINKKVYSVGGRVLNFVNISDDLKKAREIVNESIESLNWTNGFYRKDIGFKIIDK